MRKQKTKPAVICFMKNVSERSSLFAFNVAQPKGREDNSNIHLHQVRATTTWIANITDAFLTMTQIEVAVVITTTTIIIPTLFSVLLL